MQEPPEILDAIAADPDDAGAWQVLTDWLLEHGAPHAVLAAYELQLEKGTRDPELLGGYVEARRERHRLPRIDGVRFDGLTWRCGYVVELSVRCEPTTAIEERQAALRQLFEGPAFRALHRVTLTGAARDLSLFSAEQVVPVLPKTVRRVTIAPTHRNEPLPASLLKQRPPKAARVDLPGFRFGDELIEQLVAAGWIYLNLDRSSGQVNPQTLRSSPGCVFMLGGTGLEKGEALEVDGDNVRWVPRGVTEALLDDRGRLIPLDREQPHLSAGGYSFMQTIDGWVFARNGPYRPLIGGERLEAPSGRGWLEYHRGGDLDAWYRAFLRA